MLQLKDYFIFSWLSGRKNLTTLKCPLRKNIYKILIVDMLEIRPVKAEKKLNCVHFPESPSTDDHYVLLAVSSENLHSVPV